MRHRKPALFSLLRTAQESQSCGFAKNGHCSEGRGSLPPHCTGSAAAIPKCVQHPKAALRSIGVPCHQAMTLTPPPVCNPPSREGVTLLFPPTEQGVTDTHWGKTPSSRSNPDLCTTSGLHINAQLGAFQEAQHTAAQKYHSPHY